MLDVHQISDPSLRGVRTVWVQRPPSPDVRRACIFLDGELYLERVKAPEIVQTLWNEQLLPGATCIYLSSGTSLDRHIDFPCNEAYTAFLVDGLIPWVEESVQPHEEYLLCGLSLSGLAACYAVLRYPGRFGGAVCQSPSAWWNEDWLAKQKELLRVPASRIRISVGTKEVDTHVEHPPTGMVQRSSQIESCQRLAQAFEEVGQIVEFCKFEGSHEPECWGAELPSALHWLLDTSTAQN